MNKSSLPRGEPLDFQVSVNPNYDPSLSKDENAKRVSSGWESMNVPWNETSIVELTTLSGISMNFYDARKRRKENWRGCTAVMLDYDDGIEDEDSLKCLQESYPFNSYLFSSQNHLKPKKGKPACPRLRLLIPLNRPIYDHRELDRLKSYFLDEFPGFDDSCFDTTRFFAHGTTIVSRFIGDRGFFDIDTCFEVCSKTNAEEAWAAATREETKWKLNEQDFKDTPIHEPGVYPEIVQNHIAEHPEGLLAQTLDGSRVESDFYNLDPGGNRIHDRSQHDIAVAGNCFRIGCSKQETFQTLLACQYGKARSEWNAGNRQYVIHKMEDALKKALEEVDSDAILGHKPPQMAERFLQKHYPQVHSHPTLVYWNERFYCYSGTHWKPLTEVALNSQVNRYLRTTDMQDKAGGYFEKCMRENIRLSSVLSEDIELDTWTDGLDRGFQINLKSGQFCVDEFMGGINSPMHPHNPRYFTTTCLPFAFDPKAKCSRWRQFLGEVLPDTELQRMLRQMMGLFLVPDTSFQRFWILVGPGANGKSVVCNVLSALIGNDNVSNISLDQMGEKHSSVAMLGKLANIASEIETDEIRTGERIIKAITGEDRVQLNEKYKPVFTASIKARLLFACNELPLFKDRSQAIARRLLIIPMEQVIDPKKQDPKLIGKLLGEVPGILNWALEGLKDLYNTGQLFEAPSATKVKDTHLRACNPWEEWIRDYLEFDSTFKTDLGCLEVYEHFESHFKARGHRRVLTDVAFGKALRNVFPQIQRVKRTIQGRREYRYAGLKWLKNVPPPTAVPMGI